MAETRTNMVSLLDIGSLFEGATPNIVLLGDGFTDLSEDHAPDIETSQYVNQDSKTSSVKGYEFSLTLEREYIADAVQTVFDDLLKKFPTGKKCNTYYYRYLKTDITSNTGECIRIPVIAVGSSAGGPGGDLLTTTVEIKGRGNVELGIVTINAETGAHTWVAI